MILFLLKTRIKRAIKSISSMKKSNFLTYSLVIVVFFLGGYYFFYRLFGFLSPIELIGTIIADKLISYSFFIFLLLLLMSNGITALSTLYHSEELDYLHSTPLKPFNIFTLKLIETAFYSSWATLIGALPLVLSYLVVFASSTLKIILILIPLLAFISIPAGFGVSIIILLKRMRPRFTVKQLAVVLGALSIFVIYIYIKTTPYNFNVPNTLNLEAINQFVQGLRVSNPYFPNEWFYKSASGLTNNNMELYGRNTVLLLSAGLISISLVFLLANLFYKVTWTSSGTNSQPSLIHKRPLFNRLPKFLNLLQKDLKVFLRSPLQWSQLLIIGVLLIIYTFSLRRTPLYVRDPFWLSALALINTGFIGYITATLSLRFVYPQISLEGKTWWILRSSPLSGRLILSSKGFFFLFVNLIIAELVVTSSNIILVKYWLVVFLSSILAAIFSIVSVFLAISFGIIFADFSETNPAKIASGAGGLLTAALNLIYIAFSILFFGSPISTYIRGRLQGNPVEIRNSLILSCFLFLLLTAIIVAVPLKLAKRRINEIEA